jgi:hypothetical protein
LYFNAYSSFDKIVPSSMGQLNGRIDEIIKTSKFLKEARQLRSEPKIPLEVEVKAAQKIGKREIGR